MNNVVPISASLIFLLIGTVFAQDAKLIEAAKKDGGKAVVYRSLDSDTGDAIGNAFFKKTGIKMDYWRASSTKVMDRASSEYRAGKPLFDVLINNATPMQILLKDGMLTKYNSPSAKGFSKDVIDPNLGPRYRNVVIGIIYNKEAIKSSEAPKLWKICSSRNIMAKSLCLIPSSTPRRPNGSPAFIKSWAKTKRIGSSTISEHPSRRWWNLIFPLPNA